MRNLTVYQLPPADSAPDDSGQDMTASYHDTLTGGLSTVGIVRPERLWRLPTVGDMSVFEGGTRNARRLRVSFALLWDYSGSQQTFRTSLNHSLQSIGAALRRIDGCTVWAGGYTGDGSNVNIFVPCRWSDTWDHRRVATLNEISMNGTPTGTALTYVRRYVVPRAPHARRVVIVCTDGNSDDPQLAEEEVRTIRATGTQVFGLYVGSNYKSDSLVACFGDQLFVAPDRADIPVVFTSILERVRR